MLGQAAFEYIMMFSIALVILTFLTYYAQDVTDTNREEITVSNAIIAVNKITEASDIVYTQGKPSQITLSVYIPENVEYIHFNNSMIIIRLSSARGVNDIFSQTKADFTGSGSFISPESGTKRIIVRAEESYVKVTQG
jgi:hypothetical protein